MNTQKLSNRFSLHHVFQTIMPAMVLTILTSITTFGQNAEEENIKQVVQTSFKEFLNRNINKWKTNWKLDDKARLSVTGASFHAAALGWDSIERLVTSFPLRQIQIKYVSVLKISLFVQMAIWHQQIIQLLLFHLR